jgi:hypothetical protein
MRNSINCSILKEGDRAERDKLMGTERKHWPNKGKGTELDLDRACAVIFGDRA